MRTWGEHRSLPDQARIALQEIGYGRQGGKVNRRQQIRRVVDVMAWIEVNCQVHHLGQVGGRHVIAYWKAHRRMAKGTLDGYWYALRQLWTAAGLGGQPPKHRQQDLPAAPLSCCKTGLGVPEGEPAQPGEDGVLH